MNARLSDCLQIWGLQDHFVIFADASIGFCLKLKPIEIGSWDDDRSNDFSTRIKRFLNSLPPELSIQFFQRIIPGNEQRLEQFGDLVKSAQNEFAKEISLEKLEKFKNLDRNGELPVHEIYLFIRKNFSKNLVDKPKLFAKNNQFELIAEDRLKTEVVTMQRLQENLTQELTHLNLKPEVLNPDQIVNLIYQQWNPDRPVAIQSFDPDDIRSSVLFSDVGCDVPGFVIGQIYHRVISLKILPDQTYSSMVSILKNLPFKSQTCLSIYVPDQLKEIESLKTQRRVAYSMVVGKKNGVSDLESEAKFQDLETLLEQMVAQGEKVFHASLQVILSSSSPEELEDQVSQTLMLFREMGGAEAMAETLAAFDIFSQISIPNAKTKERVLKIKTSNLCDLVPLYGPWEGHQFPRVLLRNRSGGLLTFDVFDGSLANSNQLICGGSGSGKSLMTNLLLLSMLKDQAKLWFVDIGGSYKKLCENLGGQYLNLGIEQGISINPFELKTGEKLPSAHKIKFLLGLVEILVRENDKHQLPKIIRAELEQCISQVYKTADKPRLSDLKDILEKHADSDVRKLSRTLALWCGNSPYGQFLDKPTTVALDKDMICFDSKGLESFPDLQEVCLYLITDLIWRDIQTDRSRPKFVVFDKCWKLLKDRNEAAIEFIEEIVRTIRKYYGSMICLTQSLSDYLDSKIAGALLNNSAIKWILMQNQSDLSQMKTVLGLNDNEIEHIRSLQQKKGYFSEVYLIAGTNDRGVVLIEPTPIELWLATTDARDIAKIEEAQKYDPQKNVRDILKDLSQQYPHGVVNGKN